LKPEEIENKRTKARKDCSYINLGRLNKLLSSPNLHQIKQLIFLVFYDIGRFNWKHRWFCKEHKTFE